MKALRKEKKFPLKGAQENKIHWNEEKAHTKKKVEKEERKEFKGNNILMTNEGGSVYTEKAAVCDYSEFEGAEN